MVDFIAVAQQTPFRTYESATAHLEETARRAGVKHLSYWCLQFVDGIPDHVVWVSTYDPLYMSQYMAKFTPMGDPVLEMVMDDKVVIDWTEWLSHDGVSDDILSVAQSYGITKFGLSLPLASENGDKVIFSVNAESDDESWPSQRSIIAQRFRPFAQEFNIRMRPMIAARQKGVSVYSF
jgi:Autoinducer binding domain